MSGYLFCGFTITILISACCQQAKAQYYYKDIWNPQQLTKEMGVLKTAKLRTVSIKSFDGNGEPGEGFYCDQKMNKNFTLSETVTRSNVTSQSLLSSYFTPAGLLIKTTDSTETSVNITEYTYSDKGVVTAVKTFARAKDDINEVNEEHNYTIDAAGLPVNMTRKKNNVELSTVNFKTDGKGNIIEENEIPLNGPKKYFYYYDDKNNLTDVVHYYENAKRLLPDYMYEYNSAGQIKQMTTVEEGGGYYIWKYTYNDMHLRESERCFSGERKLLGSVEYTYK